ncbi:MAG: dihydroorotate dehydrogenase-like protein [Pleomorphochaeta sp.]
MANLKTNYMGLELKNPIIAASSPLTSNLDNIKKLEDAGVGAIVLKSIFQEQIDKDADSNVDIEQSFLNHADAYGFLRGASQDHYIDMYLTLVEDAKKACDIPIIASLNGSGDGSWIREYAPRFAYCGADAFEVNHYEIGSNANLDGKQMDKKFIKFAKIARQEIKLPLSLKMSSTFSSTANIIRELDFLKYDGLVLFNRFFNPDININSVSMSRGNTISSPNEYSRSLRWVGLMSEEINLDLCANTGIYDGETIIKMLLAGAAAVEVCSAFIQNGLDTVNLMLDSLNSWMEKKGYDSIDKFKGILAQEKMSDPTLWERTQYIKSLHN